MTGKRRIEVIVVEDHRTREHAYAVRREVFQREQGVAEEEEFDADDESAVHVLALVDGQPAGTGRLVLHPDYARIGRMAVYRPYRRGGVGRALLDRLMELARARGARRFVLHAQVQAIPFYESAGFRACSEVFDEAGIPHRRMERSQG